LERKKSSFNHKGHEGKNKYSRAREPATRVEREKIGSEKNEENLGHLGGVVLQLMKQDS
jgi:hypothetical protein